WEKQLSPFSQFHQGGGGEIAWPVAHPDSNVPVQSASDLPPVTHRATESRTGVFTEQAQRFLKESRHKLIIRRRGKQIISQCQINAAIDVGYDSQIAFVPVQSDDRMPLGKGFDDLDTVIRGSIIHY